jgi:hypothetical protein
MMCRFLGIAAGILGFAVAAEPVVVLSESFEDFREAAVSGQGNWRGPEGEFWFSVRPGGLDNASPPIPGGSRHLEVPAASGNFAEETFVRFGDVRDTVWVRVNLELTTNRGGPFFSLRLENGVPDFRSAAGLTLQGGEIRVRLTDRTGSHTQRKVQDFEADTVYTLVFRVEKTGRTGETFDRLTLWVNPDIDASAESLTRLTGGISVQGDTGVAGFDTLTFRRGNASAQPGVKLDAIKVVSASGAVSAPAAAPPTTAAGAGTLSFTQPRMRVPYDALAIDVPVVRQGGGRGEVSVQFRTVDGTARERVDYVPSHGGLIWSAGETEEQVIRITPMDNPAARGRQFTVELFDPRGGANLGGNSRVTVEME